MEKTGLEAVFLTGEFQRGVKIYQQNIVQVNNLAQKTASQSKQAAKGTADAWEKGFKSIAAKAAVAVSAFVTVQKTMQYIGESVKLAARVETLGVSLETVGINAGYTAQQMAEFEEGIKKSGITTQAARQSMLMMAQAQIELARGAELARVAQDAAVIANINSSEATERLIYAIQSANVRVARTIGLNVSWERSYQEMARQLGKTTDELTEQEQVQARVNEVIRVGARIAGTYEAAMGTAGKLMNSLNRLFEEAQLVIGQVGLDAFASGIDEVTRLAKDLLRWMEANKEELEDLGVSVTMLADAMIKFADLELPTEDLTRFIENMTTLISVLTRGIETWKEWKEERQVILEIFSALNKIAAWPATLAGMGLDELTKFRKANEDLFKTEQQIAKERKDLLGQQADEERRRRAEAEAQMAKALAQKEEELAKEKEVREKAAEELTKQFDRIQEMQAEHLNAMQREEEDAAIKRARAWADYDKQVQKQIKANEKQIAGLTEKYEKQRAETIAEAREAIAKAEAEMQKTRLKAQQDFERQERQHRERYNLDKLQSERRYQFERSRLVAEGDTLAIEELDARYKIEQQESKENEQLRRRQDKESQAEQIREAGQAAKEQVDELRQQLNEQLAEQEQNYQEQIKTQKEANQERLAEMAATFAEQQQRAYEDQELSARRRKEDYQRQLGELGRNMADQEALQKMGADDVKRLLDRYYGDGGYSDAVMEGWHEREQTRIVVTEEALGELAAVAGATVAAVEESIARAEAMLGTRVAGVSGVGGLIMDEGGIVRGPQTVHVGPGMVEAFVPLGRSTMNVTGNIGVGVSGLEAASTGVSNDVGRAMAARLLRDITSEIRSRRRS